MNKSVGSRTKQFEAASADFSSVISTERRNLTVEKIKDLPVRQAGAPFLFGKNLSFVGEEYPLSVEGRKI